MKVTHPFFFFWFIRFWLIFYVFTLEDQLFFILYSDQPSFPILLHVFFQVILLDCSLKSYQLEINVNFIKLLSFNCHNCYWKFRGFVQLIASLILNQFFGVDICLLSFGHQFPLLIIIFYQLESMLDLYFFEWMFFFPVIE